MKKMKYSQLYIIGIVYCRMILSYNEYMVKPGFWRHEGPDGDLKEVPLI